MKALRYLQKLIAYKSPSFMSNKEISKYIDEKLKKHGFVTERIEYRDSAGVRKVNIIGKKGQGQGGLAYFGHSDVVPAERWFTTKCGPYEPAIARERVYGRGACDMKGSLACMLEASQCVGWEDLKMPIYFVCTADEEVGYIGAKKVVEHSKYYREIVDAGTKAIIGEPTMLDVIHAHKGSCLLTATAEGKSAHSSTREGINANLKMIPYLAEMKKIHDETLADPKWHNAEFVPPDISMNIGINDHTRAINMTAGKSICTAYFRFMPGQDPTPLIDRAKQCAKQNGIKLKVEEYGLPVYTDPNSDFVKTCLDLARKKNSKTVSYGTDGGAFTEIEDKVVFGPGSIDQAHTFDEWIAIEQLSLGVEMYVKFIKHFCC